MTLPVLDPTLSVQALSLICAFMLRVTVGYAICATIGRVATSAALRFLVWLSFLLTAATYWLYSVSRLMFQAHPAIGSTPSHVSIAALPPVVLSDRTIYTAGILLSAAGALYCGVLVAGMAAGLWRHIQIAGILRHRVQAPSSLPNHSMKFAQERRDRVAGSGSCPACTLPQLLVV